MKKRGIKGWLLLAAVLLCFIFTACGTGEPAGGEEVSGSKETGTTREEVSGEGTTEALTEEVTTEAETEAGKTFDMEGFRIDKGKALYDISSVMPKPEGMFFGDFAMDPEGRVLMLYEKMQEEPGDPSFSIYRFDPATGLIETLAENRVLTESTEAKDEYHACYIAGVDPVIIYEMNRQVFYPMEGGESFRPEFERDAEYRTSFMVAGETMILDSEESVNRLVRVGNSYRTEKVWTAPYGINNLNPVSIRGNEVVFEGDPGWDDQVFRIRLRADMASGELLETYTETENEEYDLIGVGSGYEVLQELFREPPRLMVRTGQGEHRLILDGEDWVSRKMASQLGTFRSSIFAEGKGWLLLAMYSNDTDGEQLILWNYETAKAEPVKEKKKEAYVLPDISEDTNHALAVELEEEFGIQVYYGSMAMLDYENYIAEPVDDKVKIRGALQQIREIYSLYPAGFFHQLNPEGNPLRINIVGTIRGNGEETLTEAGGLKSQDERGTYLVLSMDDRGVNRETLLHETTHVVYDFLLNRGIFTELDDEWNGLNPPDFTYGYTYDEAYLPDAVYTADDYFEGSYENIYFIRPYDKTFQTEDVADLFAGLLSGEEVPNHYRSSHLQAKCRYFFTRIRQGFDTRDWPKKTSWEAALDSVGN